jgi:lipopolysaccharide/colanic/teichoic acid biosynthesis glycosyltransferase
LKRLFDIIASLTGLVIFLPWLLILSLLIKFESSGPIFFIQKRVGRMKKEFRIIKFRTMEVLQNGNESEFEIGNMSRITKLGKFLRKTKLDEIPQLVNVLIGNMSIVGPRPEVKKWTDVYTEKWATVLSIKPGITDYASIKFKNEEYLLSNSKNPEKTYKEVVLPNKLDLNINYVKNRTFCGDLVIIFRTLKAILIK